jgi:hypothetical protein
VRVWWGGVSVRVWLDWLFFLLVCSHRSKIQYGSPSFPPFPCLPWAEATLRSVTRPVNFIFCWSVVVVVGWWGGGQATCTKQNQDLENAPACGSARVGSVLVWTGGEEAKSCWLGSSTRMKWGVARDALP